MTRVMEPLARLAAVRYAAPLREGGSLPAVVETADGDEWVVKFRGAGQGPGALVAELVAGAVARELGLPVPDLAVIEIPSELGRAEPDPEIRELLERSVGANAGLRFLRGALPWRAGVSSWPSAELAADVVWFDALVTNIDRTARNPNVLVCEGAPWLIDHGAALYIQHTWREPAAHARRPFAQAADHLLLGVAGSIEDADARLADRLDRDVLEAILALVPAAWLNAPPERLVDYLAQRLEPPRPFVAGAEDARRSIAQQGAPRVGRARDEARIDA
ncbi:MAG: HipA family kinase [Candidatus Limnocylindrales bacterium]